MVRAVLDGTANPLADEKAASSFDEFYTAAFHRVAAQLFAYVGDLAEAQDITQEAFCRAWQRWGTISTYEDPVAWVRKVAWNLATSRWRKARTAMGVLRKHREEVVPEVSADHVALVRALRTLPANQRQAVVLHYLADHSVAEVAELMTVAPGTVKSWLHRARAALATALADTDTGTGTGTGTNPSTSTSPSTSTTAGR